jgi:hypothetical protein
MVKAAEWDEWVDEQEEDLRILDLGEGFLQGHEPKYLSQPGQLQVPEMIFGNSFDHRVDLWRAGCMVSSLMRSAGKLNGNVFNANLFVHIQNDSILVPGRRWCLGCTDGRVCGEVARGLAASVGPHAVELEASVGGDGR